MKTTKIIVSITLVLFLIFSGSGVNYAIEIINDMQEIELAPLRAVICNTYGNDVYQNSSIKYHGNEPNKTYHWTSTGDIGGVEYSVAYMDSYGRTRYRDDKIPHNGLWESFGHNDVRGPHRHAYTWSMYTNELGEIFHNIVEEIISSLN